MLSSGVRLSGQAASSSARATRGLQLAFIALAVHRSGKSDCCPGIVLLFLPALPASWLLAEQPHAAGSAASASTLRLTLTKNTAGPSPVPPPPAGAPHNQAAPTGDEISAVPPSRIARGCCTLRGPAAILPPPAVLPGGLIWQTCLALAPQRFRAPNCSQFADAVVITLTLRCRFGGCSLLGSPIAHLGARKNRGLGGRRGDSRWCIAKVPWSFPLLLVPEPFGIPPLVHSSPNATSGH